MLSSITPQNDFLNPGASSPERSFAERASSELPAWDKVNFQTLSSFEVVTDQYQNWGLQFEGAIALTPSNPSFLSESGAVVLMPEAGRKMIKIHLQRPLDHLTIAVRGAGVVNFIALGEEGQCLTRSSLEGPQANLTENKSCALPQRRFDLDAQGLSVLIMESESPFTVESVFFTI
ncbi:MAG: hypothetical protein QNJ46_02955 [Leptolyngbyaceae cyanobacterium MO_188.B28]|nr:hypothetical protein [Leptolyngbyaceae cyanobacterium MO_188.B28]